MFAGPGWWLLELDLPLRALNFLPTEGGVYCFRGGLREQWSIFRLWIQISSFWLNFGTLAGWGGLLISGGFIVSGWGLMFSGIDNIGDTVTHRLHHSHIFRMVGEASVSTFVLGNCHHKSESPSDLFGTRYRKYVCWQFAQIRSGTVDWWPHSVNNSCLMATWSGLRCTTGRGLQKWPIIGTGHEPIRQRTFRGDTTTTLFVVPLSGSDRTYRKCWLQASGPKHFNTIPSWYYNFSKKIEGDTNPPMGPIPITNTATEHNHIQNRPGNPRPNRPHCSLSLAINRFSSINAFYDFCIIIQGLKFSL